MSVDVAGCADVGRRAVTHRWPAGGHRRSPARSGTALGSKGRLAREPRRAPFGRLGLRHDRLSAESTVGQSSDDRHRHNRHRPKVASSSRSD